MTNNDIPLIDTDDISSLIDTDDLPPSIEWQDVGQSAWQEIEQSRLEKDLQSGVAWQPAALGHRAPIKPSAEDRKREVLMEVASWFLSAEKKFIKVDDPEMRLGIEDVAKVAKPMMLDYLEHL